MKITRIRHGVIVAACAIALSGCLPQSKFNVTVRVLDDETGQPIPGAWVFASAEVITEPQVDRFEVVGGNRGQTGAGGAIVFTRAQGMYRPRAPKDWLWKMVDEKQAKLRKPKYIAGGSIVVATAKYGVLHQPFAIEDSPAYQDWLKANPSEEYGGLLGLKAVRNNRKALLFKSKDLSRRVEITLRLRKQSAKELAQEFQWGPFVGATWDATSTHTGGSEDLQIEVYRFFAQQMKAAADETNDSYDKAMFKAYYYDEAVDHYIDANRRIRPEDQDGAIQLWLAEKALEVLPQDSIEVKEYAKSILKGVADEGTYPRWQNHFLNPNDPSKGLRTFDSALQWAGLDMDNPRNEWDWQDAQRYYGAGDKAKAYEALGHVLRVLVNLAIPKYTQMQEAKETEFESAVEALMKDQAGQLPPDYWWGTKAPTFAVTPLARFDAVAQRTVAIGLEAGIGATNGRSESPALAQARKSFPAAIGQAAGLLRDFFRLTHRQELVGPQPPDGDGDGGAAQAVQASSAPSNGQDLKRRAEDFFGRLKQLGEIKPIVKLVGNDPGVMAVITSFDQAALEEGVLIHLQRIGCAGKDSLSVVACGQAEGRLIRIWPRGKSRRIEFYIEKLLPIVNDKTAPPRMRAEYALDIIADLTGMTEGIALKVPDAARVQIAVAMASLLTEGDEGLRRWGLQGCMNFGGDVAECGAGVEGALRSPDEDFRHVAVHLFSSGANSRIQMEKRGLKGPLDGKGKQRLLGTAYEILSQGSARHPARIVATLAQSISFLGNPLIEDVAEEIPKIVDLLAELQRSDPSALVRYRAYEGLYNLSTFGRDGIKARAKRAIDGFDPREDEIRALGGPGPFSTHVPKRDDKK